ncbi:MAG: siderophore-interacting protein [Nocardioides sp.]
MIELEVISTERLSPSMVRVNFTSADLSGFAASADTDRYVKLQFPQPDGTTVARTYSVPIVDVAAGTLSIDFVIHPDPDGNLVGYAAPWAAAAQPGDQISVRGPGGGYAPDPSADWHLLAGDESALPAIGAALAELPQHAVGYAVIDAPAGHEQDLVAPTGMVVRWVDGTLAESLKALAWRPGRVQVFVHGEAQTVMHEIRPWLFTDLRIPRDDVSVSGYWRRGRTEETFRAWKRELAASESDSSRS